jgi:hypothetical protein
MAIVRPHPLTAGYRFSLLAYAASRCGDQSFELVAALPQFKLMLRGVLPENGRWGCFGDLNGRRYK